MNADPEAPSSDLDGATPPPDPTPQSSPIVSTDASAEDDAPVEPASRALRATTIAIGITAVALTIVSALVFDMRATIGVAIGGLLATVNFVLFIRIVSEFLGQKGASAPWIVLAGLKLLGLFAFMYIVLRNGQLPPLALALGYGSLPIGITLGSLRKPRPPEKPSV